MADNPLSRAVGAFTISKRAAAPTETVGTSRTSGSILTGEGAGTFDAPTSNTKLNGQQRFDEYDRITRDVAIVATGVRLFLNLISNAVWTVNPPPNLNDNEAPIAQEYADQAYAALFDMTSSWAAVVRKTAGYRFHGFSILEWTARRNDDGSIGFKDIEHRPQRTISRWLRDQGGTVEGVEQRVPGLADVTLERAKIVYAVDETLTDSPEGRGLYAHIAATATRLETFLRLEEIGYTTDLRGIPVARAPLGELRDEVLAAGAEGTQARTDAEARRVSLLQPLRNWLDKHMRNAQSGMLLPSDTYQGQTVDKATTPSDVPKWALELLSGDSTSFADMAKAVNRLNQEIARILGCEHVLLGADGGGSLALARSKVGTFYLTVTSTLLDLCEIFDRDILTPLADLNGWPEELRPQMGCGEVSDRDIEQVMDVLEKMARAGAPLMPDDPAIGEIYDLLNLTRPPEREDDLDLSLNPERNKPQPDNAPDPDEPLAPGEVEKARQWRSRNNMARNRVGKRRP